MNPIETLVSKVLNDINEKMTDVVFLVIQNDRELMHRYLVLIRKYGKNGVDVVNRGIGKAVKDQLKHTTDNGRNVTPPRSTLIQSYELHAP